MRRQKSGLSSYFTFYNFLSPFRKSLLWEKTCIHVTVYCVEWVHSVHSSERFMSCVDTQDENQKIIIKYNQKKRKCPYFGHIIRGDGVQRLLMEGRINDRRGRGRPRTMWTDNIKKWTKTSYNDCIRVAQDRERWRSMTADLLTADGT